MKPGELLRLAALVECDRAPVHGYALQERLTARGLGPERNTGALYRTLQTLAEENLLESSWDTPQRGPARRVYRTTRLGREHLMDRRKALHDYLGAARKVLGAIPRS